MVLEKIGPGIGVSPIHSPPSDIGGGRKKWAGRIEERLRGGRSASWGESLNI